MTKPLIGVTMGDPVGIGPEIILKAITSPQLRDASDYLLIGAKNIFNAAAEKCGLTLDFTPHSDPRFSNENGLSLIKISGIADGSQPEHPGANIMHLQTGDCPIEDTHNHKPTQDGGRAAVDCIFKGIDLAMAGAIDGLATAPINKEAIKMAGFDFPGHTEMLKERTNSEKVTMLMIGDTLKVAFVTSHISLKSVPDVINTDDIVSAIMTTTNGLKKYFSTPNPKVAVCGLNPHSGEAGRFGEEEAKIIVPAIRKANLKGANCIGPEPPDVVFFKARQGDYDAVVAMYHDQGTIPLKLLAFESGVNITLGIPIVRTSPDHGTAFDIAWKGTANPGSMIEAVKTALMMAECKNRS